MKLVIGNKNYSSWSMRPWLLLRHFDIEFEEIRIPLFVDGYKEHLAEYSAAMKVPVLIETQLSAGAFVNQPIWDSLAICEYLSEHYLQGQGWPTSNTLRAKARAYSCEMHSGFLALRTDMPMNCRAQRRITISTELREDIKRIDTLWQESRIENVDTGAFLFGEFSIADCMFAPVVMRLNTYMGSGMPQLSDTSKGYMHTISNLIAVKQWCAEAAAEIETIAAGEVGEP